MSVSAHTLPGADQADGSAVKVSVQLRTAGLARREFGKRVAALLFTALSSGSLLEAAEPLQTTVQSQDELLINWLRDQDLAKLSPLDAAYRRIALALAGGTRNLEAAGIVPSTLLPGAQKSSENTEEKLWGVIADVQAAFASNIRERKVKGYVQAMLRLEADVPAMRRSEELKRAVKTFEDLLPLMTEIGAIAEPPAGTADSGPRKVSMANNALVYAASRMLSDIALDSRPYDIYPALDRFMDGYGRSGKYRRDELIRDPFPFVSEGGSFSGRLYTPDTRTFSVKTQLLSILASSASRFDEVYQERGFAYRVWLTTKHRSKYERDGQLLGVGDTDGHEVLSAKMSWLAIAACLDMAVCYQSSHSEWCEEALDDALSMASSGMFRGFFIGSDRDLTRPNERRCRL